MAVPNLLPEGGYRDAVVAGETMSRALCAGGGQVLVVVVGRCLSFGFSLGH